MYPDTKKQAIANNVGMLYRFIYEMQVGDYVVFPSKTDRMINIGMVEGEYYYEPTAPEYVQQRKVKLGASNAQEVEILQGLEVGDQVVLDNLSRMRNGLTVDVAKEE